MTFNSNRNVSTNPRESHSNSCRLIFLNQIIWIVFCVCLLFCFTSTTQHAFLIKKYHAFKPLYTETLSLSLSPCVSLSLSLIPHTGLSLFIVFSLSYSPHSLIIVVSYCPTSNLISARLNALELSIYLNVCHGIM